MLLCKHETSNSLTEIDKLQALNLYKCTLVKLCYKVFQCVKQVGVNNKNKRTELKQHWHMNFTELLKKQEHKKGNSSSGEVLWNQREMDMQKPGYVLPDICFALARPTQYSVLQSVQAGVIQKHAAIHSNSSATTYNCQNNL